MMTPTVLVVGVRRREVFVYCIDVTNLIKQLLHENPCSDFSTGISFFTKVDRKCFQCLFTKVHKQVDGRCPRRSQKYVETLTPAIKCQ